jgi:KaiC/GvpD/RAD55 family RecA-like ATPase
MSSKKSNKNDILEVENMDDYAKEDRDGQNNQLHELLPKHPFRMLITGSSGCGKSNFLINLLMKQVPYDRIYVYSKHLHQSKYKYLNEYLISLEDMLEKACNKRIPIIMAWADDINELVNCDDLDKTYRNLIIIDDHVLNTKAIDNRIGKLYTTCRHKNTSIITINQMYFRTPRAVRLNLSYLVLFNNNNRKELSLLSSEQGGNLEKNEFRNMYNSILRKKYNFFLIDNETNDENLKYRNKWNGIYTRNLI